MRSCDPTPTTPNGSPSALREGDTSSDTDANGSCVSGTGACRGIVWNAFYSPYGFNDHFTFSKLTGTGGTAAVDLLGDHNRVVGCTFRDYLSSAWSGIIWVSAAKHASIYGNLFDHNGYDSYSFHGGNMDFVYVGEASGLGSIRGYYRPASATRSLPTGREPMRLCHSIHAGWRSEAARTCDSS